MLTLKQRILLQHISLEGGQLQKGGVEPLETPPPAEPHSHTDDEINLDALLSDKKNLSSILKHPSVSGEIDSLVADMCNEFIGKNSNSDCFFGEWCDRIQLLRDGGQDRNGIVSYSARGAVCSRSLESQV